MKLLPRLLYIYIIILAVNLLPFVTRAQALKQVNGISFNQKTLARVAQVTITNLQRPAMVFSNDVGMFTIKAAAGDTLLFTKPGYTELRLAVTQQNDIIVYLRPATQLEEVVVRAKTRKQEQLEVMDTYRGKGIYYNGKPPALSFLSSPLTGFYELFGKEPGRARHFAAQMKRENQQTEVNKRYTVDLVKRITKLPDDEIQQFMLSYNPPYPEVLKWNDYELIQFINRSLAGYKRAKSLPPLPKLNSRPIEP
jgi:hypothetical protein